MDTSKADLFFEIVSPKLTVGYLLQVNGCALNGDIYCYYPVRSAFHIVGKFVS